MSKYDFILDNMIYSFSRVNSFSNCPHGWELYYIFGEEQVNGFFGQFGTFCHLILEKFFKNELEIWELTTFYEDNYFENVTEFPPPYPRGMEDTYYQRGYDFFDNLDFDKSKWKILGIEETFEVEIEKYKVIVKPDLRLQNIETEEMFIFDYKSSDVEKKDEFEKAKKQISFYILAFLLHSNIRINKGAIWAIRTGELIDFIITDEDLENAKKWFLEEIEKIKSEKNFNKGKVSKYFCDYLCGSRDICKYRQKE